MSCGIPVYPIVQVPGDIVILLPNTIHWGYNMGFNINEAMNFVCRSWVLPGMLSHQRCDCNEWFCRFEIRDVLKTLGVEDVDLKKWHSGIKLDFIKRLKESQPLLYPNLRDIYDRPVEANYLLGDTAEPDEDPSDDTQTIARASCTRCNYFPDRKYCDAVHKIYNHAVRCHGEEEANIIREEVRAKFGPTARKYKCPSMVCDICQTTIRGKRRNLLDHQRSKKCMAAAAKK